MKLTDKAVKAAQPKEKIYRIFDGEGLYLEVHPNGSKYWRFKYHFGKEDRLAFGVYPKVTLADARRKRTEAHEALNQGRNPRHASAGGDALFETVALKWYNSRKGGWEESYATTVLTRLQKDVFPRTRGKLISEMVAKDVLNIISPINERGAPVKAKRILALINSIFSFAIISIGEMRYSPAIGLHVTIDTKPVKHNPHLTERELPEFLKRLDGFTGDRITQLAMKFLLITMTRTGEVRLAVPEEINFKKAVWEIPPERMKMRRPHWVPLPKQAMAILEEALSYGGDYIFPSMIRKGRPLSENTILYAIYDMGYRGKLTGHGLRGTASTILNERGFNTLHIERQLAHVDSNKIRGAYNHAEYLNERRALLQRWADLLDDLRNSQ
jgi:integrase